MTTSKHFKKQQEYFEDELSCFADYDKNLNAWRLSYIERIKENIPKKRIKDIVLLDVGVGSGYVSIELAKKGCKVVATDIVNSPKTTIEAAKKRHKIKSLKFIKSPAHKIPLKDKSVDFIVVNSVLEHVEEEQKAITEWRRILKPGGKLFITVPLKMKYIIPFFWPLNYYHDHRLGHLRRYDLKDLKKKVGLKVYNVYYTGHFIKASWILLSRVAMRNTKGTSNFDYFFERIDDRFKNIPYGGTNIIVVFKK